MKKSVSIFIILLLVVVSACKKTSTSSSGAGGSWTVNGTSYQAVTCVGSTSTFSLSATNVGAQGSPTGSDVIVQFYNQYPPTPGTYNVVTNDSALTASNQVQIGTTINVTSGTSYLSSGSGSNQTVNVSVSGGKVSIVGSGINMVNNSGTAVLSLDLHQLQ